MAKEKFNPEEEAQSWFDAAEEFMVEEMPQDALNCFIRSANLGHIQAMFEVAATYAADGKLKEYSLWTRRAAAFGHEEAIEELKQDGTYEEGWEDDFVVRVRAGDYQIEDGVTYTTDGTTAGHAEAAAPAPAAAPIVAAPAPAPAVAAPAPAPAVAPAPNDTYAGYGAMYADIDTAMSAHLAGLSMEVGSGGGASM